ncbi:hypothetical protein BJ138DRAFT_1160442 [Hygrophoropsis aurantiaca]|uniref:Uncharacterized protein n=1 Tax=Hygrophoropsis aurantiaca TaxID=72124 RepID=A0ACB8A1Z2_9AGAM|nr:hypothetical protein BJ138DRAFT_1160442 [Hygrophoropsis aurantiaca]
MSEAFPNVGIQTAKVRLAGMALLVFDYCLTLPSEVHWIWGTKWGSIRIIFALSRYTPFVAVAMTLYSALHFQKDGKCMYYSWTSIIIHVASIAFAEGLLALRIYAFWNCSRKLLLMLVILGVVFIPSAEVLTTLVNNVQPWNTSATSNNSCIFQTGRGNAVQFGFLIIYEIILLCLTLYQRFRHYRQASSPIVIAVYEDGVAYIVCISLASMANVIVAAVAPVSYSETLDSLRNPSL